RAAWAVNKNSENQRGAVCEAGDVETKIVSSPKQDDVKACLNKKDDNGQTGKPSGSGSGSNSSDKDDDDSSDKDSDDEDTTSGASSVAAHVLVAAMAMLLSL
ncbi:hypothetical protein GGF43_003529, partial [Coemansia sp. RSA 2618]